MNTPQGTCGPIHCHHQDGPDGVICCLCGSEYHRPGITVVPGHGMFHPPVPSDATDSVYAAELLTGLLHVEDELRKICSTYRTNRPTVQALRPILLYIQSLKLFIPPTEVDGEPVAHTV
jgi:hypothetical protein